jgi:dTDP-4-amino-4,6-dideoxygalactose transaminase
MTIELSTPIIGDAERERVLRVLASGHLADGPEVRAFEDAFAHYCEAQHAIAAANGTAALHAALAALDLGEGDTVLTTPFTFIATANAIHFAGAEPIFADIDPETFTLDPVAVEARLEDAGEDVAAILPVHLFGLPADCRRLQTIARQYDVALVEDAAQAHGATVDGQPVGSIGDLGCFSFYPTKNMTTGEGGMVSTDDETLADRVRRFVDHGRTEGYQHVEVGHNFRLSSVSAAIGRAQIEKVDEFVRARRDTAAYFTEAFADLPIATPTVPADRTHVYNQYTIRTAEREALAAHLESAGIQTAVYYPTPIHQQPVYSVDRTFPVAERAAEEVLSIPVHPALSEPEKRRIVEEVRAFYA